MRTIRLVIFIVVALAQLAVPASMIWKRQHTLHNGRVWKFRTAPIDPVDAFRGRYLALRFEAESFERPETFSYSDEPLYVTLKEDEAGFAVVDEISLEPRAGDNVVRAEHYGYSEGKMTIRFPFDHYWVSEDDAQAADAAYAEHSRRGNLDAYVTVRVTPGDAAIEELYIAGQPLRDYLRSNPTSR